MNWDKPTILWNKFKITSSWYKSRKNITPQRKDGAENTEQVHQKTTSLSENLQLHPKSHFIIVLFLTQYFRFIWFASYILLFLFWWRWEFVWYFFFIETYSKSIQILKKGKILIFSCTLGILSFDFHYIMYILNMSFV